MKFNEKLTKLRKQKGLSQEELGNELNVTRQTVSKWELGDTAPDTNKLKEICNFFDVSMDELVNDKELENKKESIRTESTDIKYKKSNELKPRKWLLVIMVLIEIVLSVVLIERIIVFFKKIDFSWFDSGHDFYDDSINYFSNIDKEVNERTKQIEIDSFNSIYELRSGTQYVQSTRLLLDSVITNNQKDSEHLITVSFKNLEATDRDGIKNIKANLDNNEFSRTKYEISLDYDENGYVNRVIIEEM